MKLQNKLIVSALLLAGLSGCTSSKSTSVESIKNDVDSSMKANQAAKSLYEWESSEHNPEHLFEEWREQKAKGLLSSATLCEAMLTKTPEGLALFEEEIKSEENKELLQDCSGELHKRLEKYWESEKEKLKKLSASSEENIAGGRGGQFVDNVQYRDTSGGYKAINGDVNRREVVLTFDDGPHPQYTQMVIDALEQMNAKAIFFSQGKNARAYPSALRKVAARGHSVGSHSVTHMCLAANNRCAHNNARATNGRLGMLSYSQATKEISGGHQAVFEAIGWVDPFFRFPYGEASPELKEYLADHSVGEFMWNVDSNDWKQRGLNEMINDTINQIESRGRGIVLFHDVHHRTALALPEFLNRLHARGYSVVLLKPQNSSVTARNQFN